MVFCTTIRYLQGQDCFKVVRWMRGCLTNRHYVECDKDCIDYIRSVFVSYASAEDQSMLRQRKEVFDVPLDLRGRLSVVDSKSFSIDGLLVLSSEPSLMVLENVREMEVYKALAQAYTKDKVYGNIFRYLLKCMSLQILRPHQAGGYGDIPNVLSSQDKEIYSGLLKYKSISVFDRDTDSPDQYDSGKNKLFQLFLKKNSEDVTENDVYSFNSLSYHWHMWYKRAIENYFPQKQFIQCGCRVNPTYDRTRSEDYLPVDQKYLKYNKNKLCKLPKGMVLSDYERVLHRFTIGAEKLSEFQLFLLKLMQII